MLINLCSGQRKFGTGWTNVDTNPKWTPDVVADGASMPMFADGSAEMIVIHHGLEHFGCGEAAPMIRECHRILEPGGSLLVFVPDMRALTEGWMQGRIDTQIFLTNVYGAFMDSEADRHKWGFDMKSLCSFLESCGFTATAFNWRSIPEAPVAQDWWILGVEAVK